MHPPPLPQLAYNYFYEDSARRWRLPAKFNAKPYHRHAPRHLEDAAVVHFHGPKPRDYLKFAATGACPAQYKTLCPKGLDARACVYIKDWIEFLEGSEKEDLQKQWQAVCPEKIEKLEELEKLEKEQQKKDQPL